MSTEFVASTEAMQIPSELQVEQYTPENIQAFRLANLKIAALILEGADPRGYQVSDATRHADDVFAGRVNI